MLLRCFLSKRLPLLVLQQSATIFPRIIAFHERFNVDWRQDCKMKNKKDTWHFKASTFWLKKKWTNNQQNSFDPTTPSVKLHLGGAFRGAFQRKVWWDLMLPILEGLQPVGFSSWGRKTCITRNTTPTPHLLTLLRTNSSWPGCPSWSSDTFPWCIMWFQSILKAWIKVQKSSPTRAKGVQWKKNPDTNPFNSTWKRRVSPSPPLHALKTPPPCLGTRTPAAQQIWHLQLQANLQP